MKIVAVVLAFTLSLQLQFGEVAAASSRRLSLLQLQRTSRSYSAPLFQGPSGQTVNVQGFCVRPGCTENCEPVCTEPPCCCWSTYAAEEHPLYPSNSGVGNKQQCMYPPAGYVYAPDPGLTYNDGYLDELRKAGLPEYDGRKLCCLHRAKGAASDSQNELGQAVPTTTTTTMVTVTIPVSAIYGVQTEVTTTVPPEFAAEAVTTSLMKPGDEYENAQLEEGAQKKLEVAQALQGAVSSLNSSATDLQEVNDLLQNDPNMVRSRNHIVEMNAAIHGWAQRRWANLKKLATGDASAFTAGSASSSPIDSAAPFFGPLYASLPTSWQHISMKASSVK